jgi:hypothetical protein
MLPPDTLPVVLIGLDPVFIPAAVTVPITLRFPPVILPVALIVLVVVNAWLSAITVLPLILIAIFVLLYYELGLFLQLSFDLSNVLS